MVIQLIIAECMKSSSTNPYEIFHIIARKDFVRMHGPEHHMRMHFEKRYTEVVFAFVTQFKKNWNLEGWEGVFSCFVYKRN